MAKKQIMAAALAATMVIAGTSVPTLADEGGSKGSGNVEDIVSTDVFSVVLPTATEGTYDFTLDPQGLIKSTDAAKYNEGKEDADKVTFGDGNLFFKTDDKNYGATSKTLTAVNKSSFDVDISLSAELKNYTGLKVASKDDYANATDPSIYLAIESNPGTVAYNYAGTEEAPADPSIDLGSSPSVEPVIETAATESAPATATAVVNDTTIAKPAAKDTTEPYVFKYDSTGKAYSYVLNDKWTGDYNGVAFALTGGINTLDKAAGWASLKDIKPSVDVTWKIDNPKGPKASPASMSTTVKSTTISGADSLKLSAVKVIKTDGTSVNLTSGTQYTYSNGTFSIVSGKEVLLDSTKYSKFVLTFNDNTTVDIAIVAAS